MNPCAIDIFFTFAFFSISGWILEVCYRSVPAGRFVNPGLLTGPYLPLYGAGALLLIIDISLFSASGIIIKIMGFFVATTGLELVSALIARYFFNTSLWDYSDQRFNYKGHICLKFSIYWIILAFGFEYLILPFYQTGILQLPLYLRLISGGMIITIMAVDFSNLACRKFLFITEEKKIILDKEFMEIARSIAQLPGVAGLSKYEHHHGKTRLYHVIEVAYLSFRIGKRLSLDCRSIVKGSMLHDLFFYDWLRGGPRLHGFRHPAIALENAKRITSLTKKEEDIIKKHMWPLTPCPPLYRESLVVSLVDTFCSVKDYMRRKQN